METLKFDLSKKGGKFKYMNAVNNGPIYNRRNNRGSNLEAYKAAGIPFARNHDASFCASYGGEHTVDISAIFPNFDADPYDPASYDFACTDDYTLTIMDGGAQVFYRLGQKIEHYVKKYHIFPPKDFQKWAVICEHIIRHYNEGWADGFHYDIKYWEIWNEADGADGFPDSPTWQGTRAQFFDLYCTTAIHLKKCFPDLKIGGPSLSWDTQWAEEMLIEAKRRGAPVDFFSWHRYTLDPNSFVSRAAEIDELLKKTGFENAENICNEWNYIKGWRGEEYSKSFEVIKGMKGAAFTLASMIAGQKSDLDMMMYYDARPGGFNCLFDGTPIRLLKGYYTFLWYSKFYAMEAEIRCENEVPDLYTLCGVDSEGKSLTIVTYYTDEEDMPSKDICLDFGKEGSKYEVYLLDEEHSGELAYTRTNLSFTIKANTCIMIKEI